MGTKSRYLANISKDSKSKEKEALAEQAEQSALQLNADIAAATSAVRSAKKAVLAAESAIPLNSDTVLKLERSAENAEADLKALTALRNRLFEEEVEEDAATAE